MLIILTTCYIVISFRASGIKNSCDENICYIHSQFSLIIERSYSASRLSIRKSANDEYGESVEIFCTEIKLFRQIFFIATILAAVYHQVQWDNCCRLLFRWQ